MKHFHCFWSLKYYFLSRGYPKIRFGKYVSIHLEALQLLFEANYDDGNGMDDATKIQHLKNSIKANASLEHALTTAHSNRLPQGDFKSYVTFLLAEEDTKNKRRVQLKSRERQIKAASERGWDSPGGRENCTNNKRRSPLCPMLSLYANKKR